MFHIIVLEKNILLSFECVPFEIILIFILSHIYFVPHLFCPTFVKLRQHRR